MRPVRVWDLPTRLFHALLILSFVGSFVTIKLGGLWMDWHVRFGLLATGLIIFRLIWGVVGGYYSRFSQFPPSLRKSWEYLRQHHSRTLGHNPLGAWSVYVMLLLIGFQAFSGLFANDDIFTAGPLAYLSPHWSKVLTGLHKSNEWLLLAIVALHIIAILAYRLFAGQKLAKSMVTGNMDWPTQSSARDSQDGWKSRLLALVIALLIAAAIYSLTLLAPTASFDDFM